MQTLAQLLKWQDEVFYNVDSILSDWGKKLELWHYEHIFCVDVSKNEAIGRIRNDHVICEVEQRPSSCKKLLEMLSAKP